MACFPSGCAAVQPSRGRLRIARALGEEMSPERQRLRGPSGPATQLLGGSRWHMPRAILRLREGNCPPLSPRMTNVDGKASTERSVCCNFCPPISKVTALIVNVFNCTGSRNQMQWDWVKVHSPTSASETFGLKTLNLVGGLTNRPPTCLPIHDSVHLSLGSVLGGKPGGAIRCKAVGDWRAFWRLSVRT